MRVSTHRYIYICINIHTYLCVCVNMSMRGINLWILAKPSMLRVMQAVANTLAAPRCAVGLEHAGVNPEALKP